MIGVASATKLCRSIVIKGMEALMVDLNLAAEKAGVLPAVIEKSAGLLSRPGLGGRGSDHARARVKQHGLRRAAEMREVSRMMREYGLNGSLVEAIADRHESFAKPKSDEVGRKAEPVAIDET